MASLNPNEALISIAIIENEARKYYGLKRKNNLTLIVDNYNKVFEIGSITKIERLLRYAAGGVVALVRIYYVSIFAGLI